MPSWLTHGHGQELSCKLTSLEYSASSTSSWSVLERDLFFLVGKFRFYDPREIYMHDQHSLYFNLYPFLYSFD